MLTPVFSLSQTDSHLQIEIRAPYSNVKDAEIDYCEKQFVFVAKPYFLRLYLPCELCDCEQDTSTASYDCEQGQYTVMVGKKNNGEYFPYLDMVNKLLKPSKISGRPLLEEVEGIGESVFGMNDLEEGSEDTLEDKSSELFGYGFAWRKHGIVGKLIPEIGKFTDLKFPENSYIADRVNDCFNYDKNRFNADHYIADLFDREPLLEQCISFEIPEVCFQLSFKSRDHLKDLRGRVFTKFSIEMQRAIILSLADILYAYLYDLRTTFAEHSVESGRSALLQCLTDIRIILSVSGDFRYLYNELYITDYCIWIQHVSDDLLQWLAEEIGCVNLTKADIGFGLEDYEMEAAMRTISLSGKENAEKLDSDDEEGW